MDSDRFVLYTDFSFRAVCLRKWQELGSVSDMRALSEIHKENSEKKCKC